VNWNTVEPTVKFSVEKLFWLGSVVLTVLRKLVPVRVNVGALPATTQAGETEVTVGMGLARLLIMKVIVLDRPLVPVP